MQQLDLVQTGIFLCLRRYSSDGYVASHNFGDYSIRLQTKPFLGFGSIADKAFCFEVSVYAEGAKIALTEMQP